MISFISPTPGSFSSTNNIIWSGAMFSSLEVQGKNPAFDPTETNPTSFFYSFAHIFHSFYDDWSYLTILCKQLF